MGTVGQIEKMTQARVVALFRERLGYAYLGNWVDRPGNANIEPGLLAAWLKQQGVSDILINRAFGGERQRGAALRYRRDAGDLLCISTPT